VVIINRTIRYINIIAKRLPSRVILIISFLIRKLSKDFDSRFNVRKDPILENVLMPFSIFNVCVLIDASNGDTKGTYVVTGKKFLFEVNMKSAVNGRK
jgi:hypothetical protein